MLLDNFLTQRTTSTKKPSSENLRRNSDEIDMISKDFPQYDLADNNNMINSKFSTNHASNIHHGHHFLTTNGFSLNLTGAIRRRFSETYYKSLEHQKRPRLVKKCGELNIHMENVPKHKRRLFRDMFNTILDIKWRYHILYFFLSFLASWLTFAFVWYFTGKHKSI
jgi:hypothetical protein